MQATSRWGISCSGLIPIEVITRDGLIAEAPPYLRTFIGRPLANLEAWAKRNFRGIETQELL